MGVRGLGFGVWGLVGQDGRRESRRKASSSDQAAAYLQWKAQAPFAGGDGLTAWLRHGRCLVLQMRSLGCRSPVEGLTELGGGCMLLRRDRDTQWVLRLRELPGFERS